MRSQMQMQLRQVNNASGMRCTGQRRGRLAEASVQMQGGRDDVAEKETSGA